ncbi:hypothetical protein P872_01120 [Rhodonellum psychrophilum GCM71 = DSM 17998]|uniref:Uncharacterized protein n=1 Tax=Rhodonellum psychrophilum GCM71 = DSM 17998 TaxID=1123057 RepID=U5C275_9BACT|nr:hypothetical protein P872_01120 [Rhodonellum psychrophilum GCM71 = DSM 17998]
MNGGALQYCSGCNFTFLKPFLKMKIGIRKIPGLF